MSFVHCTCGIRPWDLWKAGSPSDFDLEYRSNLQNKSQCSLLYSIFEARYLFQKIQHVETFWRSVGMPEQDF